MNLLRSLTILCAAAVLSGCGTQTVWMKKNLDTMKPDIDSVSIIFPHVKYSEKSGEAKVTKVGYSVFVSRMIAEVLKEIIDEGNCVPKSATIMLDSTVIDQWLPQYFLNSIIKYKQICDSLQKSQNEHGTFTLTPELQLLVDNVTTKYFIFVSGIAFGTSEESKRYDMLQAETFKLFYDRPFIYDYQWSGLQLYIYIVETKSKEIVWHNYNDPRDTKYSPIKKEDVKDLCKKLMQAN
jgi:hypothetical protein